MSQGAPQLEHVPQRIHVYRNHSLDSTRWDHYRPREGDVVVASSYKSGTTWLQAIVLRLFHPHEAYPPVFQLSPWLESPVATIDATFSTLEQVTGRRVMKTHLPLDGLPFHDSVRYVVVCRDARDVFVSLWNHYSHLMPRTGKRGADQPGRGGASLPPAPDDVRVFWRDWLTRGWFDWETEGYPFWSNLRHTQTWWEWRHLQNIRFVHFNGLLGDLRGEVASLASFLEVPASPADLDRIAQDLVFDKMKAHADRLIPTARTMLRGGSSTFFHRGVNGQWRDLLGTDDLQLYREAVNRELSPECSLWLEGGAPLRAPG